MATTLTMRCRAFDGEGAKQHRLSVDRDGTVRVWDSVAGHYTTCHSLGRSALARIRRAAARAN